MFTMVTVLVVASFAWENIHLGTASPDDQELISQIVQASQLAQQRLCVAPGAPLVVRQLPAEHRQIRDLDPSDGLV